MTILECKLINEMKKRGIGKLTTAGILNLITKPQKQKRLMEYIITSTRLNTRELIYKSLEIAKN